MKNLKLVLLLLCVSYLSNAQNMTIDVVINSNAENTTVGLNTYAQTNIDFLNNQKGCITYKVVKDRTQGSSPYILEMWESEEHVAKELFYEKRTKRVEVKGGYDDKEYRVSGVRARAIVDVFCRITERETTSIIDQYMVEGHIDREIADDNAKSGISLGVSKKLPPKWMVSYGEELDKEMATIKKHIGSTVFAAVQETIANKLLPPTMITKIVKKDGDKVKEVGYEKCLEQNFEQFGNFAYGVYSKSDLEGNTAYTKQGTVSLKDKKGVLGVGNGKKEMLPLLSKGDTLYIGKENAMESFALSEDKTEKPLDLSFIFFYDPLHNYSEADKRHIEFLYQSQFLNYRNIRVIAYDPLTVSLNETTTRSIFDEKKENTELKTGDIQHTKSIYVEVSKAIPAPKAFKSKLLNGGKERDPSERFVDFKTKVNVDSKEYKDHQQLTIYKTPVGHRFYTTTLEIENVANAIIDNTVEIIGVHETKKDKLKKVIVLSTVPLDGGEKYEVFASSSKSSGKSKKKGKRNKKRKSKKNKTKKDGEIKVDKVLNRYLAIAEVKDGDKELKILMDKKSNLTTKKKKGGFFSGGEFSNSMTKFYPKRKRL